MIEKAVSAGVWKPIKLSRQSSDLSYLFLDDGLILFAEASMEQLEVILNCLNLFMRSSGQKVNYLESQMHASQNVEESLAKDLSTRSSIPLMTNIGRYLGVNSIHGRVTKDLHENVLDRITARLEGLKSRFLSFARRQIHIISILNPIPLFVMQTNLVPKGVCNKAKSFMRRFMWGGALLKKSTSLVKWEKIIKPVESGGLGLKYLHHMNLALMAKLGWRVLHGQNDLWACVLINRYMRSRNNPDQFRKKSGASNVWKGISKSREILTLSICNQVGNGRTNSFWMDNGWM